MKTLGFRVVLMIAALALLVPVFLAPVAVAVPRERSQWEWPVKTTCSVSGRTAYEFEDGSRVTVIHNTPGSILLSFGGPDKCEKNASIKEDVVLQLLRQTQPPVGVSKTDAGVQAIPIHPYFVPRPFDTWDDAPFGNSAVRTRQKGTATRALVSLTIDRDTVNGLTETAWFGWIPQSMSDQRKLSESWRFHGWGVVSLSIPPGVGFSGSGDTINWFAHDTLRHAWRTSHSYTGVSATGLGGTLTGVTKSAFGSHLFGTHWVSAFTQTRV